MFSSDRVVRWWACVSQRGREGADAPPAVGCPKALQGWWESVGFARDRKHQRLGYPLTRRRERTSTVQALTGRGCGVSHLTEQGGLEESVPRLKPLAWWQPFRSPATNGRSRNHAVCGGSSKLRSPNQGRGCSGKKARPHSGRGAIPCCPGKDEPLCGARASRLVPVVGPGRPGYPSSWGEQYNSKQCRTPPSPTKEKGSHGTI